MLQGVVQPCPQRITERIGLSPCNEPQVIFETHNDLDHLSTKRKLSEHQISSLYNWDVTYGRWF